MSDILQKITLYMQQQKTPVSAVDIAQQFLNMTNVSPAIADKLVASLLAAQPQFCQTDIGHWTINRNDFSVEAFDFFICKIFPERTASQPPFVLHLAHWDGHEYGQDQIYFVTPENVLTFSEQVNASLGSAPLLFDGFGNQLSTLKWLLAQTLFQDGSRPVFMLKKIVQVLLPDCLLGSASDMSKALAEVYHDGDAAAQFSSFKEQTRRTMELLRDRHVNSVAELQDFVQDVEPINFAPYSFNENDLREATTSPGVYVMRDKNDEVIYVGKAKNLRRRLLSYFIQADESDVKLKTIRTALYRFETIETGSELEALLTEYELIRHYDPPINRQYDVHPRRSYSKQRYERIFFLPGTTDDIVQVFLFNPAGRYKLLAVEKNKIPKRILRTELRYVFADVEPQHSAEIEIITSWLSRFTDDVSNIDMRSIASVDEALRLIELYVKNFDPRHKQIFQ